MEEEGTQIQKDETQIKKQIISEAKARKEKSKKVKKIIIITYD